MCFQKLESEARLLSLLNLKHIFGKSISESYETVKAKFDELRQWWKDWNGSASSEEEMATLGKKIKQFIAQEENK